MLQQNTRSSLYQEDWHYYARRPLTVLSGRCEEVLAHLPGELAHAVVCDPPYGLSEPLHGLKATEVLQQWLDEGEAHRMRRGFMGHTWDGLVPGPATWAEILRATRPGGYCLAFAGTRTAAWMGISLMLAGWEVLDQICWLYAEGRPPTGDVSKQIDAQLGAERWEDQSTRLKPAHEPILVTRRPLRERSVVDNLLAFETGALNIGGCRIPTAPADAAVMRKKLMTPGSYRRKVTPTLVENAPRAPGGEFDTTQGRWPANVIVSHAPGCGDVEDGLPCVEECPVRMLDEQSGPRGGRAPASGATWSGASESTSRRRMKGAGDRAPAFHGFVSGASRFYFCPKASRSEREAGLEHFAAAVNPDGRRNRHATVKPVALMRYLCRLVGAPAWGLHSAGLVLDPFAGSGTTGVALALEGLRGLLIEQDPRHAAIARARVAHAQRSRRAR